MKHNDTLNIKIKNYLANEYRLENWNTLLVQPGQPQNRPHIKLLYKDYRDYNFKCFAEN